MAGGGPEESAADGESSNREQPRGASPRESHPDDVHADAAHADDAHPDDVHPDDVHPDDVEPNELVVRLHHEVVDTPAPRRALSPAQALHLAMEGPARGHPTATDDTIVLPDAPTSHSG